MVFEDFLFKMLHPFANRICRRPMKWWHPYRSQWVKRKAVIVSQSRTFSLLNFSVRENWKNQEKYTGKRTENEIAMGSSMCPKDHSSLSAKFFFLLSANSAFVFFVGPGFWLSKDLSPFFTSFHDFHKANNEKRRAISKSHIVNGREAKSHVNKNWQRGPRNKSLQIMPFSAKTSPGNQHAMRIMTPNCFINFYFKKTFFEITRTRFKILLSLFKKVSFIANFYFSPKIFSRNVALWRYCATLKWRPMKQHYE